MNKICDISYFNPIAIKIANFIDDNNKNTILKYAIKDNNFKLCKYLLHDLKLEINFSLKIDYIFYAIKKNNTKIIQLFLKYININNINLTNKNDETILCIAIRNNNSFIAKKLINMGADVNGMDNEFRPIHKKTNYTPLCLSVINNNYKLTKFLLYNGANPNIWSDGFAFNDSYLPLHKAIEKNNLKLVKLLFKFNALSETQDVYYGHYGNIINDSPLQLAIKLNKTNLKKIIKLFFHYGQYN